MQRWFHIQIYEGHSFRIKECTAYRVHIVTPTKRLHKYQGSPPAVCRLCAYMSPILEINFQSFRLVYGGSPPMVLDWSATIAASTLNHAKFAMGLAVIRGGADAWKKWMRLVKLNRDAGAFPDEHKGPQELFREAQNYGLYMLVLPKYVPCCSVRINWGGLLNPLARPEAAHIPSHVYYLQYIALIILYQMYCSCWTRRYVPHNHLSRPNYSAL